MEASAVKKLNDSMKTVKKAAADTKGKDDKARLDTDAETLQKSIDTSQKDLDDSKKSCKVLWTCVTTCLGQPVCLWAAVVYMLYIS